MGGPLCTSDGVCDKKSVPLILHEMYIHIRDVNDSVTLRKMYVFVRYVTIIRNVYMYF